LGTVEVRIMDAQSSLSDVAPIVALIQSLSRLELVDGSATPAPGIEVLAENRFLAARDGMGARLIEPGRRGLTPVRDIAHRLLSECRPHASALGCAAALEGVTDLVAANGAARQRDFTAGPTGLDTLVEHLALDFDPQEGAATEGGWPITATNAG
jgi:carboxylate-amine ligase